MSAEKADPTLARERPELLIFCGALGLAGSLLPLPAMIVATWVAEHGFVADSLSDLGRGPHHAIMDSGFYVSAAGLLALAIAAAHAHLDRLSWSLGIFCLAFLALVVTLLGIWDEFGRQVEGGLSVHTRLTFVLGPLYLAGPLLMRRGVGRAGRAYPRLFVASAGLWIVFATAFKLAPDSYDGILEKIAIAATLLWTVPLSWLFLTRGLARRHRLTG